MNFRFSKHAEQEMAGRGISRDVVEGVLASPAQKVPEHGAIVCYQSVVEIDQKIYLVRIMVNETTSPPNVVTVGLSDEQAREILKENVKVTYDPEVDVLRIVFRETAIEESDEDKPGVILDYDKDGNIVAHL